MTLSTDYVRTGLSSLTFNMNGTQTIPVAIVDDMVFENTESFSIVLSNPQPDSVVLNPDTITITITDNDAECECHKFTKYARSFYVFNYSVVVSMYYNLAEFHTGFRAGPGNAD